MKTNENSRREFITSGLLASLDIAGCAVKSNPFEPDATAAVGVQPTGEKVKLFVEIKAASGKLSSFDANIVLFFSSLSFMIRQEVHFFISNCVLGSMFFIIFIAVWNVTYYGRFYGEVNEFDFIGGMRSRVATKELMEKSC